jgi:hypothetical protein
MNIEQKLYQAAIDLIEKRYPSGWVEPQQCTLKMGKS